MTTIFSCLLIPKDKKKLKEKKYNTFSKLLEKKMKKIYLKKKKKKIYSEIINNEKN